MTPPSITQHEAGQRLHRVLAGVAAQVEHDLDRISESPESGVHSLRRRMKKLASILRFAREHVPDRTRQQIRQHIRLLKDAFASQRDEDVLRKLRLDFGIEARAVEFPRRKRVRVSARQFEAAVKLRDIVCNLPLHAMTWDDIASSFLRSFKRERKAWMAADEESSAEALHEWRKKTKALYYQMLFIHQITGGMTKPTKHADSLGRWLGRYHDLDGLASRLKHDATTRRWLTAIRKRQKELRRHIFHQADRLHDHPTVKSTRRLADQMATAGRK